MNPHSATLDEIRDWLAREDGWVWEGGCKWTNSRKSGINSTIYQHPYPPTLDGAASAMPKGWTWFREAFRINGIVWSAHKPMTSVRVNDTGDEIAARYRLAMLARMAEDEAKEKQA